MKHREALIVAEWLVKDLRPGCERIEIKGSVCRGKPQVKDIEVLAIPILKPTRPEFGKPIDLTPLDRILRQLVETDGMLKPVKGGEKFKQFEIKRLEEFGIAEPLNPFKLDLFLCTPPSQWGVLSVIRTGPDDFSQWMVTQKHLGGALPDGFFVRHNVVWAEGTEVPNKPEEAARMMRASNSLEMPEEMHFFAFCGLEWIEPEKRVARWAPPAAKAASPHLPASTTRKDTAPLSAKMGGE